MEFLLQTLNSTTTLLEKVNENNNTMEPLHYPVMAPAEVELPAPAASSADGQICVDGAAPEPASADKGQGSEHSIEQVDPKTPGWTQRVLLALTGSQPWRDQSGDLQKKQETLSLCKDRNKFRHTW
ncbi:uncharacterized protein LOC119269535 [Triticum dicoccoides]|uniref:uncharacterized protein LOC119269535 n=1 Tax=Triticum dicoccoides TaxID=85692 RepID=UPI00188DE12E|nr:uncharacterized protein LOC119269535 [Triticum dicoccoides]